MAKPLWISHRGLRSGAIENTLEAFRAAVGIGFSALETDLRLSADGHIVLHHDPDLKRLAGDPRPIASLTRVELERVKLGGGAARLLFFDRFLQEFPGCSWTFDIKPETGAEVLRMLHGLAAQRGFHDWLVAQAKWLTWSAPHEALLKELFPAAQTYAREVECWRAGVCLLGRIPALAGLKPGRTYALPARLGPAKLLTKRYVDTFHRFGARVIAFLPESTDEVRAALAAGVDEILTNGTIFEE